MLKPLLAIGVVFSFGFIVMYNAKIREYLGRYKGFSETWFYRFIGRRLRRLNVLAERSATLRKDTYRYKFYQFLKDIIVNLDLEKDNVTPVGLLTFIVSTALCGAFAFSFIVGAGNLFFLAFIALFFFVLVLFYFFSLLRHEKKEMEIMDAEDLIAMDVKGGVYNAIVRYRNSFHPHIRPYFEEFIDNIQEKGYSFRDAMLKLNERLGPSFSEFAQKAILYEEKADEDMDDIFSSIVEINRHKRTLRYENNLRFNALRWEFIIAVLVIAAYGVFSTLMDPFLHKFFTEYFLGKLLIIVDIVIVTLVLAYLSSIKSKFL